MFTKSSFRRTQFNFSSQGIDCDIFFTLRRFCLNFFYIAQKNNLCTFISKSIFSIPNWYTSTFYFFAYFSSDWNGFFNWTMTYRQDSDFYTPYGKVQPISSSLPSNLDEHIQQFGDKNKGIYSNLYLMNLDLVNFMSSHFEELLSILHLIQRII